MNKDTHKEFVQKACSSLIVFFYIKRGFIRGVVASLLCTETMRVNLYFIIFIFGFFNLRLNYSNLLCMKEKGFYLKLNMQEFKI